MWLSALSARQRVHLADEKKQEVRPAAAPVCQGAERLLPLPRMDRELLIFSTLCFFFAMVRTALSVQARNYQAAGLNFFAIALGFVFQTAFLSVRGHALGRCPLTNLFEVFIFLAWSVSLIYLVIGPAYRLSLMGAFTAPLVFILQDFALLAPIDRPPLIRQESLPRVWVH